MGLGKHVRVGIVAGATLGLLLRLLRRRRRPAGPPPRGDHPGWHRNALAALDLETTGVDPLTDRVLSYALLGDRGDDICGLVDPKVPIPPGSAAVHGLTAEVLVGAPGPEVAIAGILDWIADLIDRGVGLVVFNSTFDLTMLRVEAARAGLPQPDWDRLLVVDPYVIDRSLDRGRRGARRLTDVAAYYGVRLDHAHDATADARAAREVAREIGWRHPGIAADDLGQLMQRQRAWHATRAEDWNAYARTVGRPLDDPEGWPLLRDLDGVDRGLVGTPGA